MESETCKLNDVGIGFGQSFYLRGAQNLTIQLPQKAEPVYVKVSLAGFDSNDI